MISKSAATQFSVMIIESTRIPSQHGLLRSQQGLCAHMEQSISWGSGFVDNFQGGNDFVFGDGLFVLINTDVSCGGSLVDYFLFLHYAAFGDDYRVNRGCARVRNRASAGEAVSPMISKSAATQFLVTIIESTWIISESTRTVRAYGTKHQLGKRFRRQFPRRQRLRIR